MHNRHQLIVFHSNIGCSIYELVGRYYFVTVGIVLCLILYKSGDVGSCVAYYSNMLSSNFPKVIVIKQAITF